MPVHGPSISHSTTSIFSSPAYLYALTVEGPAPTSPHRRMLQNPGYSVLRWCARYFPAALWHHLRSSIASSSILDKAESSLTIIGTVAPHSNCSRFLDVGGERVVAVLKSSFMPLSMLIIPVALTVVFPLCLPAWGYGRGDRHASLPYPNASRNILPVISIPFP